MSEEINVRFVIPKECVSEDDCCEEMKLAFTACEPHIGGGLQARWVHEKNFTEFNNLTKKDVFVLSQFDGEIFQKLKATKCL
ncbi:hypothetical protein RR48_01419 [Papilio machaon]|uniref:Uncharacterized protein n=2 Tax=Papilio machaon TaxID=76193 RepID=A0A0N1IP28_PAPMA|nr:hypothetical protein RR48_01419 [Papilio machaon]